MFPMSIHTAQPIVADRRDAGRRVAAVRHRFGRTLRCRATTTPRPSRADRPVAADLARRIRRPLRRVRRGAVA